MTTTAPCPECLRPVERQGHETMRCDGCGARLLFVLPILAPPNTAWRWVKA